MYTMFYINYNNVICWLYLNKAPPQILKDTSNNSLLRASPTVQSRLSNVPGELVSLMTGDDMGLLFPLGTLLSSMTVFRDSIHIGSMSPSSKIHLGPSWVMLASSRMIEENSPKRNHRCLHFQVTINLLSLNTNFPYQLQPSEGGVHGKFRSELGFSPTLPKIWSCPRFCSFCAPIWIFMRMTTTDVISKSNNDINKTRRKHDGPSLFSFSLEKNCFTMLCWFLSYYNANQL